MNAIILAAGLGTRFKEWTKENHKSLFPIQGIPNIERTIQYLIEAEVQNIYIITGYMSEKFTYLEERYKQVKLINNPNYDIYNSIFTFSLAMPYFSDSWVIDADTVLTENIFKSHSQSSTYFTILRNYSSIEWCPIIEGNKVVNIKVTDEPLPSLSGISFWSNDDCLVLKDVYQKYMTETYLTDKELYWDNIAKEYIEKLNVNAVKLPRNSVFEMDTQKDYVAIMEYFKGNKLELAGMSADQK